MDSVLLRIPSAGFTLEGRLYTPQRAGRAPGVVVCHPHPQRGGDMDNNVVVAITRGLVATGAGALPFNFRGVDGSGGAYDGGAGERDDVTMALAVAAERPELDPLRLGLAGYSFGAGVAASAVDERVRALALVSPPMRDEALAGHLAALAIPVLVLAGSEDHVCAPTRVEALAAHAHIEAVVVPGIDHFWWGHETVVSETIARFFARHLGG